MATQPHLKITSADISPLVLLPGDPARVNVIGQQLESFRIIANNREFRVGVGYYGQRKFTVCSTGIGCPSTAIAVEELIQAGAKYLIRVGTCGGAWRSDISAGSVVIPTAAVRDEGATAEYIPLGFPAVADPDVVLALRSAAKKNAARAFAGINRTHDAFYGSQSAMLKWGGYLLDEQWKTAETPILSSDMETSAVFVIASLRGVKAGCILAVNAEPEPLKQRLMGTAQKVATEKSEAATSAIAKTITKIALDAVIALS